MSENSSNEQLNSSENDDDFRVSALLLRTDIKRRLHNGIEKRRKDKINYWIHKLAELLPFKEPKPKSKTHLLETIYQYINQLKEKNDSLMFGSDNTINTIHVEEIRRLNKRCKELEEKTISYYRLLETAGISPNSWPQDIQFERPTKYSKKITEQQLKEFLAKNSENKSDKNKDNNKRSNESTDENSGQSSIKRLKSSKSRSKKRRDRERERNLKCSPPTPVLPKTTEQLSPITSSSSNRCLSVSSGQSTTSGQIVFLNDQNLSTVSGVDETPKFIVNTNNGFNGLNTFQFRPTVGPQQLQILSTAPSMDSLNTNTNLLSGQLLLNLNPPAPQPQATAVLLPNGQIVPLITQPQPTQSQPLLLAANQSYLLSAPNTAQTQQTIISGQTTATISSNIKTNNSMNCNNLTQNSNESQKAKPVSTGKLKKMTTTIETIVSQKPIKKRINKSIKKQIFSPKAKNSKKDKGKHEVIGKEKEEKSTNSAIIDGKAVQKESESKNSDKTTVEKSMISSKDKTKNKSSRSSDKSSNEKTNENIVNSVKNIKNSKSKPVLTAMSETPDKKMKESSKCDILAKATQSIFSPPPNTCAKQQVNSSGNKKEVSVKNKTKDNNKWNGSPKDITINDNHIKNSGNKCKKAELESNRLKSETVIKSNQIEVISQYSVNTSADSSANTGSDTTSANITNKANIELINDTNKNDNYVHNRTTSEQNSKIEKTIASGNKAEINKKSVNNLNNSNAITTGSGVSSARNTTSVENKSTNASTPERTTVQTNSCQSNANHQSFPHQSIASNSGSDSNRLIKLTTFDFNSQQNQTNSNSIPNNDNSSAESQAIVNESELPSILLSLNDANEVSAESVHSVSNSSLPAFLSLSPEHLNEYLPKDHNTESETSNRDHTLASDGNAVQFRISPNHSNVEQHSTVRPQESSNRHHLQQKEQQNYNQYATSKESSVTNTPTESRSSYTSNFPTISTLIANDYSDFPLTPNKSMFVSNNSTNYFENFNPNPLMNPKMSSQNNNFLQFPLQNDNSIMPLYPMHSYPIHNYLQNNTNSNITNNVNRDPNSNTNRNTFFTPNESQPSIVNNTTPKVSQNPNQSHTTRSQATALTPQQSKTAPTPPQSTPNQPQNQSNTVMPMRSQRNTSTEQQVLVQQRHVPQQQPQHTSPVTSNSNSSNKTNSNSTSVQYSTHNSFSSYSAEALIRQNEPTVQQIQSNEQNRYNPNTSASVVPRVAQQSHSANLPFNSERNPSRASISYSAESLIQSNSMNISNQMSSKSSQREVESESLNSVNDNNRISYYQHINHNNSSNTSNNLVQRSDQNHSNNLFNFDNSLNSRITSSSSNSMPQNCGNSYPQITFNSHLPDIRTSTATTSSESLFPITSNATTVNTNTNRTLTSNSISNNNNSNNSSVNTSNQISHTVSNMGGTQQQPSPVIYPTNNSQNSNSQQTKRSATNSFNSGVNAFIHSNADNYLNASHSSMYSTSGPPFVDPNINANPNQYQRSSRNPDLRFGNCLQPTNQNSSSSTAQHNNPNTGCFFANTTSNATFFPTSSGTPFPPLLPSAPSPFDATAPFSTSHRPPMFPNSFMPDFNPPFVNTGGNTPLPPITGSNFNINPSVSNNTSNSSKQRETHPTNTRSSSNMSRSPNQSKHSKISANSNTSNTKTKKQNNSKHNESSNNTSSRHSNDNYFSMNDLMSSTTPTNTSHNRYPNFVANSQTHQQSRQPIPSPTVSSSHSTNTNNKNVTSSADTSSSYTLFRPQSQNVNNSSNVSNAANFTVNSLQNSNRSAPTTSAQSHFGSSTAAHHSSHATNFHLSNIFPDINSNNSESLALSPMKFPPPVTPVAPPPVGQTSMDANPYPNHHSSGHHQNIYHSHHSSARISTPHNAFNSFLSSGTQSTHNPNNHPFDPHITPNNRTAPPTQMSGIGANSHSTSTLGATHSHSHHSYPNIVPSFNF